MYNTYIYGTPLGFDFYEDVASLKDYFKGLYISSRKGRRLMVNRRADGVTFYNYLHYGLVESGNRQNSFFGMTITMDEGEYASNLKEVFDWFDYLFDTLVKRGNLFFVNAGGSVQYKVSKFSIAADEVEWLKGNLPNIFTKSNSVGIRRYDSSFAVSTSGQIRCFNDETPETKIIDAFRRFSWVAISPVFKQEEEPIEIDPTDIESQLNCYTEQLLAIAMNPTAANLPAVKSISSNCAGVVALVQKYLSFERDDEDRKNCVALIDKAKKAEDNASALIRKIQSISPSPHPAPTPVPSTHTRRCAKCGKVKDSSAFASETSKVCTECEKNHHDEEHKPSLHKCPKCGKEKPLSAFKDDSLFCVDCLREQRKNSGTLLDLGVKQIAKVIVVLFVIGFGLYKCIGSAPSQEKNPADSDSTMVSPIGEFDKVRFDRYIELNDFEAAYNMIYSSSEDNQQYAKKLQEKVELYMWSLLSNSADSAEIYIQSHSIFLRDLGIDRSAWLQWVDAIKGLNTLLVKASLSEKQRTNAKMFIASLPADLQEGFNSRIAAIPDDPKPSDKITPPSEGGKGVSVKEARSSEPYIKVTVNGKTNTYTNSKQLIYQKGTEAVLTSNQSITFASRNVNDVSSNRDRTRLKIIISDGTKIDATLGQIKITIRGKK